MFLISRVWVRVASLKHLCMTLDHYCFVLRMGCKALGLTCMGCKALGFIVLCNVFPGGKSMLNKLSLGYFA